MEMPSQLRSEGAAEGWQAPSSFLGIAIYWWKRNFASASYARSAGLPDFGTMLAKVLLHLQCALQAGTIMYLDMVSAGERGD